MELWSKGLSVSADILLLRIGGVAISRMLILSLLSVWKKEHDAVMLGQLLPDTVQSIQVANDLVLLD